TPGDPNFIDDGKVCMTVVDGIIMVLGANTGVKVKTEELWNLANRMKIPRIIYISKMDMERADFDGVVEEIGKCLVSVRAVPVLIPLGQQGDFKGVVDLIKMKAHVYEGDGSGSFKTEEIPADLKADAEARREKMIETLVEADDSLMEKYLEGKELTEEDLLSCLRKGVKELIFAPVACGSSVRNFGVAALLDLINACIPPPDWRVTVEGKNPKTGEVETRELREDEAFSALVFKTVADPFAGKLTLFRVYSGALSPDSTVYNGTREIKERVGQIFVMVGKKQKPVGFAGTGDIAVVAKLKETRTGDTLCDEKRPIVFSPPPRSEPVISFALKPKSKGDEDKVASALQRLMEEDPTIRVGRDEQTKEIILSGMGQVHVEVVVDKLKRKFGVEVDLEAPKVPYKETIKKPVKGVIYRHKKQTGGRGQFAEVHFDITPLERGKGFEFENALTGMNVPRNFVPAVEKGIAEAMRSGVLAGYPVVDLKIRFYDGKSHEVDSSEMAFKIAASMCFKKGAKEASPVLLEPIMRMEVVVPDEHMGDVIGDINSRRGRVLGVDSRGNYQVIKALVPMAEVLKYDPDLRSMTGGRGSFSLEFDHYEEVPAHQAERIIQAQKQE
ncbi:MAG: elongation factor G, partial [Deltaproteobacteria bacterium]|nr:elongation factor G [Deltaproteobacteria bacterium]